MIDTNGSLVVVDVREEGEYCDEEPEPPPNPPPPGHIPGALNYPWNLQVLQQYYYELPSNADILVVCKLGSRSAAAADFLCNLGFSSIYNMTGGMSDWEWETVGCCYSDEECDDELFCNGEESCVNLNCQLGPGDPCAQQPYFCCDAVTNECIEQDPYVDYDCDGETDDGDNCYKCPNGADLGTCVKEIGGIVCSTVVNCTMGGCRSGKTCQMEQGDCNDNGIGDVCECYADVNCDGYVQFNDLKMIKQEYNRLDCSLGDPCYADFNGDGYVEFNDLKIIKFEFNRDDCPIPDILLGGLFLGKN